MRLDFSRRAGAIVILTSLAVSAVLLHRWTLPLDALPVVDGVIENDCFQGVWNLWFATESLVHGRNPFHTDGLYAPVGASLAHHTLSPGFAPLTALVRLVTGGAKLAPLYAYNLLPIVSFAAMLAGTFWFLRSLGFCIVPSSLGAAAYAFGRFHMHHIIHPNYDADFCVPICFALLVRLYRRPTSGGALAAGAAFGLSAYFTEVTLYAGLAVLVAIATAACFASARRGLIDCARGMGARGAAALVLVPLLAAAPYIQALLGDAILKPSLAEAEQYSANALGFLVPDPRTTPLYGSLFAGLSARVVAGLGGSEIFLGFVPVGLAIVALVACWRRALIRGVGILAAIFLVLSLGPALAVLDVATTWPLPYALLGRLPIFETGRTPVRFLAVGTLFVAVLAAGGMAWLEARLRQSLGARWAVGACLLLLAWCWAEMISPPTERRRFEPPPLDALPAGSVLNLPPREKDGYAAMLQVLHGQPIATGYTARISPQRLQHVRGLRRAFDKGGPEFWPLMIRLGYRSVIVTPEWVAPAASLAPLGLPPPDLAYIDRRDSRTAWDCDAGTWATVQPLAAGRIDFADPRGRHLCYGWGDVEDGGRWSVRGAAALVFATGAFDPRRVQFRAAPFLVPGQCDRQRVELELNGVPLGDWVLDRAAARVFACDLPPRALRSVNELVFRLPDAESRLALRMGSDRRTLAIHIQWVELSGHGSE